MSVTSVPGDVMQSEWDGQKHCWSRRTWLEAAAMCDKHNGACGRRVSIPNAPMGLLVGSTVGDSAQQVEVREPAVRHSEQLLDIAGA